MIVNSKIKKKSKTISGVIRNLVFDFILYPLVLHILYEKVLDTCNMSNRLKHQIHYASLEEVSKKNYDKQFTTVTIHKNVQNYYKEKCTYNVIIHWNLLYALKIWNCLNFIQKRRLFFFFLLNQVAIY